MPVTNKSLVKSRARILPALFEKAATAIYLAACLTQTS